MESSTIEIDKEKEDNKSAVQIVLRQCPVKGNIENVLNINIQGDNVILCLIPIIIKFLIILFVLFSFSLTIDASNLIK